MYRENTVRASHVLHSVTVHFKSAEHIVTLTTSVVARSLMSQLKLRNASYPLIVPICHSLYISIVSRNHICLSKSAISAMFFKRAVNKDELTVSLPYKALLIARCSSGKSWKESSAVGTALCRP